MSFHVHDDELKDRVKSGAKIAVVAPPRAEEPADEKKSEPLVEEMRALAAAVTSLMNREQPVAPAPVIHVKAPQVTVNPEINVNSARSWDIEVTERNPDHSIKRLKFTALE